MVMIIVIIKVNSKKVLSAKTPKLTNDYDYCYSYCYCCYLLVSITKAIGRKCMHGLTYMWWNQNNSS